jgi:hypothetical protein
MPQISFRVYMVGIWTRWQKINIWMRLGLDKIDNRNQLSIEVLYGLRGIIDSLILIVRI